MTTECSLRVLISFEQQVNNTTMKYLLHLIALLVVVSLVTECVADDEECTPPGSDKCKLIACGVPLCPKGTSLKQNPCSCCPGCQND